MKVKIRKNLQVELYLGFIAPCYARDPFLASRTFSTVRAIDSNAQQQLKNGKLADVLRNRLTTL
jgi:hypothetical protein